MTEGEAAERPRVTVVIPTYNRSPDLLEVLGAVLSQDHVGGYEVVVVDDGSRDDTPQVLAEWVRRHPGRLRAVRQDNQGPARARNRGVEESRGDLIAFLDDDCVPDPSWLRLLEGTLGTSGAAAAAGAVQNSDQGWIGRYINREQVIDHVMHEDGSVEHLITANAGVRRAIFREMGGFNEAIRVAGGEDTEFGLRLTRAGHRMVAAPQARVRHLRTCDLPEYLRMIFRHGRGRRRLGETFPAYAVRWPHLTLLWLAWPFRAWMLNDLRRYRRDGVPVGEALRYVGLRYLENMARIAGYIEGT